MSVIDDYNELKKKRKKEEQTSSGSGSSLMSEYNNIKAQRDAEMMEEIAPLIEARNVPVTKESDDRWFNAGLFSDGYQFGDVFNTILGTGADVLEGLQAGLLEIGEGVVDTGAYIAGGIGGLFSEDFKDDMQGFIQKDLINGRQIARDANIADTILRAHGTDMDEASLLGGKADALVESGGQLLGAAGLQLVGVPWWLTTGLTSFGGEVDNAFNQGATYGEAGLSGAITAGAEILTEKISGGIKFGGNTLDDAITKKLSRNISNKVVRTATKLGMDVLGEGGEEVLSGLMSAVGQKITYADEEELNELFSFEGAWDAFIGGAVLGGFGSGKNAVSAGKHGVDSTSGMTKNEEAVFKKVYNDRVAEAEKDGKLSSREKNKIHDEVLEDMAKGRISTDTIEEVLGGESYNAYKNTFDSEEAMRQEYDELYNRKSGDKSSKDIDREAELKKLLEESKTANTIGNLKTKLGDDVLGILKSDAKGNGSRLLESYNEKARRSQAYEADLTQYDEKQQAVIQKAIDSGILNNTRRTHEFVDMVAKISADKGVLFDFTDNDKLKDSGFAIDGKVVNGYVTKDGITVNIDSAKSMNSVVGHEITHVLEGTEVYDALKQAVFDYAKSKGDYQSRYDDLSAMYKNVKDANLESELVADMVGDYLFTDPDFINNLSANHRNIFQKIFDEIKYLYKMATAGSKEARELEKVKRAFEQAYRGNGKIKDSKTEKAQKKEKPVNKDKAVAKETVTETAQEAPLPNSENVENGKHTTKDDLTFQTKKDLNKFFAEVGAKGFKVKLENGKFVLYDGYYDVARSDTAQGIFEEFCEWEDIGAGEDIYSKYQAKSGGVKYSISDSDGRQLTKEQQEYFKNSKMRDENGNLKVMYHGSQDAGFHVFDARMSDDDTSFFFVDRNDVAASYSGTSEVYEAKTIRTAEDMNNFLAEIGYDQYEAIEENGKFVLYENGDYVAKSDTAQGIYEEFCWYEGVGDGDANYKVYLNLTNPLEVDGKGRPWNKIDAEFSQEVYDKYQSLTAEEKAALTDLAGWEDFRIFNSEIQEASGNELASAYAKMGEDCNIYDLFSVAADNFSEEAMRENARKYLKTRDYAQRAKEQGYDGVIFKNIVDNGGYSNGSEGASTVAIAFNSNQIKSTANVKPTGDADIRFSLSDAVEETKDLMALHNLTEAKLLKSLKLGGLPMPSVAIAKAKDGHGEFGEISLILPKETIDPKANALNKLYSGDAWTPMYPKVEYKPSGKVLQSVDDKISNLVPYEVQKELGSLMFDTDNARSNLDRYNGNMVEAYKQNDAMKYAYLKDTGSDISLPMKEDDLYLYGGHSNASVRYFAGKLVNGLQTVELYKNMSGRDVMQDKALMEAVADAQNFDVLRTLEPGTDEYLEYERNPVFRADEVSFRDVDNFLSAARKLFKNGVQQTVDRKAAKELIRNSVDQEAYESWLDDLFAGVVEKEGIRNNKDYMTPSGNRRSFEALHYENNLENVIKAMREQGEKGIGNGFGGASIFGASTTGFSSIEDMKQSSDRLQMMTYEEYQELRKQFTDRFLEIAIKLPNTKNDFMATDSAAEVLTEAVAKYKTRSGIENYLRRELKGWATYSDQAVDDLIDLVNDIRKMPTGYFEAKPQRAVSFDEVGVFVIPRNADVKLKQDLLNNGYAIAEYDPDVEGDRTKVLNQFEEYKFSLSDVGQKHKTYGRHNVYGKDIRLDKGIAPVAVAENTTTNATAPEVVTTDTTTEELFPDTPMQDIEELTAEAKDIMGAMEAYDAVGDRESVEKLLPEYEAVMEKIGQLEDAERQRADSLVEGDIPPEMDAPYYGEPERVAMPDDPFENREWYDIGNRKVKAYMYENPEVKPFFQEEALNLLGELNDTTRGEKWYSDEAFNLYGNEGAWSGVKRHTSASMEELLDSWHMSYADIEKGLKAIIEDNGAENIAAAKKLEFMLNDRLLHGYKDFYTNKRIPPNQDYINLLNERQINEYRKEAFDNFMAHADEYAPPSDDSFAPIQDSATEEAVAKTNVDVVDIAPTAEVHTSKGGEVPGQKAMYQEAVQNESSKTAEILIGQEHGQKKKQSGLKWMDEHIFRHGAVFEDLALKTGNRELQARFDNIRRAESRAQTFIGKGKNNVSSLLDVKKAIESAGKTKSFNEYLYHMHNVDRMTLEERFKDTPNKAVFGDTVTAEASRKAAAKLLKENPEFKQYAEEIYGINKYLLEMTVDEGIISRETADLWQTMYPHYVPISRVGHEGLNVNVPLDTNKTGVNAPIKKATGGNSDIYDVFETMGSRISQTYKAIAKNRFGVELKNTLGTVIENETAGGVDEVLDSVDAHEELLQEGKKGQNPTFTVFENGERVKFEITDEMYEAMKPSQFTYTNKVANAVGNARRDILTTYSPTFAVTNPIKDIGDILVNSQHPARTYATIPEAIKSVIKKDHWYQERMEHGGDQDTYFDSQTKTYKKEPGKFKKIVGFPFEKIRQVNEAIEQIPRMAEYIASRKMGRSIDVSMLDAARVTTNFGAAGDFTNMLNRNGFTFLGASVEGFNQQVRNVREAKAEGLKGWGKLAGKYLAAGLPALLLNHLLWDDDEEYEELSDYVKQNYYVVAKFGDGKFLRIPKGRAVAVIQDAFQQMENLITGNDEVDLESFGQLVLNNLAPNNPLDNNIISPLVQTMVTEKTWYGDDLVPTRLQDMPAAEQYDETTDAISKWIGEAAGKIGIDISPYKVNYLLDQYSGGVGDIALPYLTPAADGGGLGAAFRDKFVTDSTMKNQNVTDFYDKMDDLEVNANSAHATDEDILMSKYMNAVNSEMSELYKQKREIQNSGLSDKDKNAQLRKIQQQIVDLAKEGLDSYGDINYESDGEYAVIGGKYFQWYEPEEGDPYWRKLSEAQTTKYNLTKNAGDAYYVTDGNVHYRREQNGEWTKISDKQLERQQEVTEALGITPNEYWSKTDISFLPMSDGEYEYAFDNPENYAVAKAVGGYDAYRGYSKDLYDIKADKDENGKSISGSRKDKVIDYINGLDADYGEKIILYKSQYPSDDSYNYEIIDYLNGREDISYEDMETILKELGFNVSSDGTITWD